MKKKVSLSAAHTHSFQLLESKQQILMLLAAAPSFAAAPSAPSSL